MAPLALRALAGWALLDAVGATPQRTWLPLSERPTDTVSPSAPTPVYVAVSTTRLSAIDAVSGTFYCDAYIYLAFRDDRYNATPPGTAVDDPTAWQPAPEIINLAQDSEFAAIPLRVAHAKPTWVAAPDAGSAWLVGESRQRVTLTAQLDLQSFPHDSQVTGIILESLTHEADQLQWVAPPNVLPGLVPPGPWAGAYSSVSGWDVLKAEGVESTQAYGVFGQSYSRLSLLVRMRRQSSYYGLRYVMGCALLVVMAILALFVRGDVPERIGFAQASFLGIVSWQFVLAASSPALGYSTRLDRFMLLSLMCSAVMFAYMAIRFGYFKSLQRASGRLPDLEHRGYEAYGPLYRHAHEGASPSVPQQVLQAPAQQQRHINSLGEIFCGCTEGYAGAGAAQPVPAASGAAGSATGAPIGKDVRMPAAAAATGADDGSVFVAVSPMAAGRPGALVKCYGEPAAARRRPCCCACTLCWAGSWAKLNPHRKLDLIFGLTMGLVYFVASAVVLEAGVGEGP